MNKSRNSKPTTMTIHPLLIVGPLIIIAGLITIVIATSLQSAKEPTDEVTLYGSGTSALEGFVFQYDEEPNHMSSLVYNCEGGVLCLVLDEARVEDIQNTLQRHPKAEQIYIGPDYVSTKSKDENLEFKPGREWLESAIQDVTSGDYASITLVRSVPTGITDDQAEVPANVHRVNLYLTLPTVDMLMANIEANYASSGLNYCVIWQSMTFDQTHIGSYKIYYDELQAAHELLSKDKTHGVVICVDILPPDMENL